MRQADLVLIGVGAGLVGVIALYFLGKSATSSAGQVLSKAGNLVNPTSDQNIIYQGTNAVGKVLTQDQDFSLGAWIYEKTHPKDAGIIWN